MRILTPDPVFTVQEKKITGGKKPKLKLLQHPYYQEVAEIAFSCFTVLLRITVTGLRRTI